MGDADMLQHQFAQKQGELAALERELRQVEQKLSAANRSGQAREDLKSKASALRTQRSQRERDIETIRRMATSFNVRLDERAGVEEPKGSAEAGKTERDYAVPPEPAAAPVQPPGGRATYCPQCGTAAPAEARFCMKCGTSLNPVDNAPGTETHRSPTLPLQPAPVQPTPPAPLSAPGLPAVPTASGAPPNQRWQTGPPIGSGPVYPNPQVTLDADRRRAAVMRSYVTPAVLTLVLYFVLWLPGLVANLVYWRAAVRDERLAGQAPEGKGCLVALLWIFIIIPILLGLLIVVLVIAASAGH